VAGKRIFLFTDDDDPELGDSLRAKATQKIVEVGWALCGSCCLLIYVQDMYDLGIVIKPFFMASPGQPFNVHNFYGVRESYSYTSKFTNFMLQISPFWPGQETM
jgi:hypothetical protein